MDTKAMMDDLNARISAFNKSFNAIGSAMAEKVVSLINKNAKHPAFAAEKYVPNLEDILTPE